MQGVANNVPFEPTSDDEFAIAIATEAVQEILRNYPLSAQQVIGLGHALLGLERFPAIVNGLHVEFSVTIRAGDENFRETRYITFGIYESTFEMNRGGSVYEKAVGGDRYSEPGWQIDVLDSSRMFECDLWNVEHLVSEYLNSGASVEVSDESKIDSEDLDF